MKELIYTIDKPRRSLRPLMYILILIFFYRNLSSLTAQDNVELFGYFESQCMGTKLKSDFYQLYTNKLRVDLKSNFSDNITLAANFDYITYNGKTKWDVLEFLPENITSN